MKWSDLEYVKQTPIKPGSFFSMTEEEAHAAITIMTPEEYGEQNAKDAALAEERANKHYRTEEMAIFRGAFQVGFRAGLDHGRAEMETKAIEFRLENALKLEVENVKLRAEIERLKKT